MNDREYLQKILEAWDELPSGRYSSSEIEDWLIRTLSPAIATARHHIRTAVLVDPMLNKEDLGLCALELSRAARKRYDASHKGWSEIEKVGQRAAAYLAWDIADAISAVVERKG